MQAIWKHPLSRELLVVLVIKLALITALWWGFFRDNRVEADVQAVESRLLAPQSPSSAKPER